MHLLLLLLYKTLLIPVQHFVLFLYCNFYRCFATLKCIIIFLFDSNYNEINFLHVDMTIEASTLEGLNNCVLNMFLLYRNKLILILVLAKLCMHGRLTVVDCTAMAQKLSLDCSHI